MGRKLWIFWTETIMLSHRCSTIFSQGSNCQICRSDIPSAAPVDCQQAMDIGLENEKLKEYHPRLILTLKKGDKSVSAVKCSRV